LRFRQAAFGVVRGGEADQTAAFDRFQSLANSFVLNDLTGPEIARTGELILIRIVSREVSSRFVRAVGPGWWDQGGGTRVVVELLARRGCGVGWVSNEAA
jgi:hypothetical protein